jgi:hypothetical protein
MSLVSRRLAPLLIATASVASIVIAPMAMADPALNVDGRPASAVVDDLKAQGYNVEINWVNGFDTKPLSLCWVTNINDPGGPPPSTTSFTTVYVDVMCPNHDGD